MNKLLAYCTSRTCTVGRFENTSNYKVKDVSKTANICPDCGSALLWKKENTKAKVKDVAPRQHKRKTLRNKSSVKV